MQHKLIFSTEVSQPKLFKPRDPDVASVATSGSYISVNC